ncbi:unnamed protein product [Oppiella nova]|uniref:Uncharacterized protein n=1 Tax=Oppiella nova TaxID=334625 RepID=A0A7R9LCG9_9ACAR|nr:unnamed protein product [Oppiella nova]CAG2162200.1 unnamed protein product [Oppiella nova]
MKFKLLLRRGLYCKPKNIKNPWTQQNHHNSDDTELNTNEHLSNNSDIISIEIWSKASIGFYLWQHILKGSLETRAEGNGYVSGALKTSRFRFKFRSGPLLTTDSLQHMSGRHLILVLNGRDKHKIQLASDWLSSVDRLKEKIVNIGVVVLGDEHCHNSWLRPYLQSNGGFVKFVFIVYDWKQVDNRVIYQWPLGVATYRQFPTPDSAHMSVEASRPYACNLVATIYPDSSRLEVLNLLKEKYRNICIIKERFEWQPKETPDSLNYYVEALRLSDLTLSPMGMNHECYRIFEAMAYGSVPVIEENVNHLKKTNCDSKTAFRLLKEQKAPFIYVSNWTQDLPNILNNEQTLSLDS